MTTAVEEKAPSTTELAKGELQTLCAEHGGLVKVDDIVSFARRRKTSAIRKWMDDKGAFDPKKAAEEYPKIIARQLIMRVKILVPDDSGNVFRVRAFTSLDSDRVEGSGYRQTMSVLSDEELLPKLEATLARELRSFEKRYAKLMGMAKYRDIFNAIQKFNAAAG